MGAKHDQILTLHRQLDLELRRRNRYFVSGWNTTHPLATDYFPLNDLSTMVERENLESYSFLGDSMEVISGVQKFHRNKDNVFYPKDSIVVSAGSSPLLLSFFFFLKNEGIDRVYYVPPLYYTCYYFSKFARHPTNQVEVDAASSSQPVLETAQ